MEKIILWVPNFSEGRNKQVIEQIQNEALKIPGCILLDSNSGYSTHRTIFTFAGSPVVILEAALRASKLAFELIDMSQHVGEHPRIGALDVSPFIPVKGVTLEECVEYSKTFGQRLASTLDVPVYLYGRSSDKEYRNKVPQIREGEYESLKGKLLVTDWKPDYGPARFVPTWGASIVGCRDFLIPFNVNVLSTKEQAHTIAMNIRESGRGINLPGKLKHVQALGWMLEEDNMAQISTNILDFHSTPIYQVYEEALKDSKEMKLAVIGSEIIGIVPIQALLDCAKYYIETEDLMILDEESKIKLAIDRLGLNTVKPFDRKNQILEYKLREKISKPGYKDMKINDFIALVGSRSPVPGGGAVSALVASLGTSLTCMVGLLSQGTRKLEANNSTVKKILPAIYENQFELLDYIDKDSQAFKNVLAVNRREYKDSAEKSREKESALQNATEVPLELARKISKLWDGLIVLSTILNPQAISDLQVSVRLLHASIYGCKYNVLINLKSCQDATFTNKTRVEISEISSLADDYMEKILGNLEEKLSI
ncbi:unnamed protein product [Gordionus sp. m RMFG-2023]|uniref:formimidoyltransferase-cyclodeaminase-like n=1 Tax=Gordionus sp. m RMFG-2023 TaxID=3053472 RepID=UPI0030DECC3B